MARDTCIYVHICHNNKSFIFSHLNIVNNKSSVLLSFLRKYLINMHFHFPFHDQTEVCISTFPFTIRQRYAFPRSLSRSDSGMHFHVPFHDQTAVCISTSPFMIRQRYAFPLSIHDQTAVCISTFPFTIRQRYAFQ